MFYIELTGEGAVDIVRDSFKAGWNYMGFVPVRLQEVLLLVLEKAALDNFVGLVKGFDGIAVFLRAEYLPKSFIQRETVLMDGLIWNRVESLRVVTCME